LPTSAPRISSKSYVSTAALYTHQTVEKALKAAIIALKRRMPPKIHVLDELYDEISDEVP